MVLLPALTGHNSATFDFNHNMGVIMDDAALFFMGDGTSADAGSGGSTYRRYREQDYRSVDTVGCTMNTQTKNSTRIIQYRVFAVNNRRAYYKLYSYGGTHRYDENTLV